MFSVVGFVENRLNVVFSNSTWRRDVKNLTDVFVGADTNVSSLKSHFVASNKETRKSFKLGMHIGAGIGATFFKE